MANCLIKIGDYTISNFIKVAKNFIWYYAMCMTVHWVQMSSSLKFYYRITKAVYLNDYSLMILFTSTPDLLMSLMK